MSRFVQATTRVSDSRIWFITVMSRMASRQRERLSFISLNRQGSDRNVSGRRSGGCRMIQGGRSKVWFHNAEVEGEEDR